MAGAYPVRVATPCGPRIETAVHSPSDSIDPRPGAAYAGGDRTVVARLAQLELDALGLHARST